MPRFLSSDFCLRLTEALAHFLWQGALIAVLGAVLSAALARRSSRVRYAVFTVLMLVTALCLPATFLMLAPRVPAAMSRARAAAPEPIAPPRAAIAAEGPGAVVTAHGPAAPVASFSPRPPVRPTRTASAVLTWSGVTPWATAAYCAGVTVMLLRLVIGLYGGQSLRRTSVPVEDPIILRALARQAKAIGLAFTPAIAFCHRVVVPTVVGVFRPMVLLPVSLASGLTPDQVEALIAHELAHIRRYDHLVNILQRLIEAFLFFHPGVWYLSRRVRIEREHCCDDRGLAAGGKPADYAHSLVHIAEQCLSSRPRLNPAALGAGGPTNELHRRIVRLLGVGGP